MLLTPVVAVAAAAGLGVAAGGKHKQTRWQAAVVVEAVEEGETAGSFVDQRECEAAVAARILYENEQANKYDARCAY